MRSVRVAFAGLSPLCEDIFRAALARRPEVEFVSPWTRLSALGSASSSSTRDVLVVQLEGCTLPETLHALLTASTNLRIIGLSADARTASIFSLNETRTHLFDCSAEQLCTILDGDDPHR